MIRNTFLGLVSTVAVISSAYAGDIYGNGESLKYAPGYSTPSTWTGFYVGVDGGYAWDNLNPHGGVLDNGGFGGGQIGYNWQNAFGLSHHFLLGVEADFQGTGIDHTGNGTLTNLTTGVVSPDIHHRSIDELGTVRGRAGLTFDRTLFYVTGGFAYGNVDNTFDNLSNGHFYKADGYQTGYVIGGGIEYKLTPSWSFKTEYQYVELTKDRPIDSLGGYVGTKDTELNTVRAGMNYHFGSGYEPLK